VPILSWLPSYQRSWLRFDLIAGLTVWAVIVPEAVAYAQ
jgi:sulfate permease, SulP family